ncbi:uncharacterized protein LOC120415054 [Culex pipiens pallens]|uniref:uncharacterized protein LOC120415054 n=1 Tax=Culex pipiens pallens TaxID=42434 RepID=UPI0019545E8D|nr:uncharacterized protein LOC120415054 [Culex pipiens pallens]
MNWTPGRIVGTVKPAGAAIDPISAGMVVPCPVPAPVVPAVVQTITVPKPVPAGTVAPAATPMPNGSALLKGSVQSLAGGDKIVGTVNIAGSSKPGLSSEELKQKAIDEIHRDVQRGRVRAAQVGALGWRECPLKKTNKRFLSRTVSSVLQHNKRETLRNFYSSTRKLIEMDQRDEGMDRERRHHHRREHQHHRHRRRSRSEEEQRERRKSEEEKIVKINLDDELEDGEVRDDDE